jgi:DnaJ-class molecular chaperone
MMAAAYKSRVEALLSREGWSICTSMYQAQQVREIADLTAAFMAIVNSDVRKRYIRKLMAQCLICSLCEGRGWNRLHMKDITCIACGGSGWAAEYKK